MKRLRPNATHHVVVLTSTFPASLTDTVPGFVRNQILALKRENPRIAFTVLAPHSAHSPPKSRTATVGSQKCYAERRFHYFWPRRFETLAGHGIAVALKEKPLRYLLLPFFVGAEFLALWRLARDSKPDMLYAHWFTPQGIVAGWVSWLTGIPFAYTSHSSDVAVLRSVPGLGPWAVRHYSRRAQAITVVSRRTLQRLQAFFTHDQWKAIGPKVAVIPMGVEQHSQVKVFGSPEHGKQGILFVGRLVEKKGVQFLLPAFAHIMQHHPAANLTIAGDGPWLERLKQQARGLKIPDGRVAFPGYVTGRAKASLIAHTSIFVVPSIETAGGDVEGLPVALLEGLAAGKICIATNESGADEVLQDGFDGYLVPHKNAGALAAALDKSLRLTAEANSTMRRNGLKCGRRFGWRRIARQHYQALFERRNT